MHAIFIPYGIKDKVDLFIRDMQSQKHKLPLTSPDGKETKSITLQGHLRILPFGVMEYIFPKEDRDIVLTTLKFDIGGHGSLKDNKLAKHILNTIRKVLGADPVPKFDTKIKLPWMMEHVSIIPIGIKSERDKPVTEEHGAWNGWTHEAI